MSRRIRGAIVSSMAAVATLTAWSGYVQAQVAVGLDLAAPVAPLNAITVPDVNVLGILDGVGGLGADAWPVVFGGAITQPNKKLELQQLGKALFWDMQVGGDGIQACATCHYHAGADNRKTNQMSPGLKMTHGGPDVPAPDVNADTVQDLFTTANATLTTAEYGVPNRGLPVSEAALIALAVRRRPGGRHHRDTWQQAVGHRRRQRRGVVAGRTPRPV